MLATYRQLCADYHAIKDLHEKAQVAKKLLELQVTIFHRQIGLPK